MKIIIDTHDKSEEEVENLLAELRKNWDVQVNNYTNDPAAISDIGTPPECQHIYINGTCTKCGWIEI